jgi:hypothetical protein
MIEVRQTIEFSDWLRRLKDADAVARIVAHIRRMELEIRVTPRASAAASWKCGSPVVRVTASTMFIVARRS